MATDELTFGIELEFLCVFPIPLFESAGKVIYDTLLLRGVPATGHEDVNDDIADDAPTYSRWRVDVDHLFLSPTEEDHLPVGWDTEAVELSSRKFNFFQDDWRGEIAAVLKVLRDIEDLGCRYITNKSTGFHVHIGNNDQRVPLRVAKNVFQLVTAFERCLDELHAVQRIQFPSAIRRTHYYYPPSFFHAYGDTYRGPVETVFDRLANIENALTYEALGGFFEVYRPDLRQDFPTNGHNSAYNFDNLFPGDRKPLETLTGTIEFRQHTGTLDQLEIFAWLILMIKIVQYCTSVSADDMIHLCLKSADMSFRLEDLFVALDCPEDVMDHYLNGGTIGLLSEGDKDLVPAPEAIVNLIAQNDSDSEWSVDPSSVKEVIDHRLSTGLYGLDKNLHLDVSVEKVREELREAFTTVRMSGVDERSEDGLSKAIAQVFRQFASLYQQPKKSQQLPLESTQEE